MRETDQIVAESIAALEAAGVDYMVVGSYATTVYGDWRSSLDVDFVVQLGGKSLKQIIRTMGDRYALDPQISFESVTATRRRLVSVRDSRFRIKFFLLSDDPHDVQRFSRRRRAFVPDLDCEISLCTKEDVVITKLRWARDAGRTKDREDLETVLSIQRDSLDFDYIHEWTAKHGTRALLDEILGGLPNID